MKEYWNDFWNTKAGFERIVKTAIFGVGSMVQAGVIPTGIDKGGWIGSVLMVITFLMPQGEKNLPKATPAAPALTAVK